MSRFDTFVEPGYDPSRKGKAVFGIGPRSRNREVAALVVMSFMALIILVYWGFMRVSRKMARDAQEVPREIEEPPAGDPSDPIWRDVAERRRRDRALEEAGAPGDGPAKPSDGEGGPSTAGEAPALEPWRERRGEDISREDAEWIAEADRKAEAERAKFLPPLAAFKPLEPDAVQRYRIRIEMRVAKGQRPKMPVPGSDEEAARPVVKASKKGLTLQLAGEGTRELSWGEVPAESFYRLARQVAVSEGPMASAGELIQLAHLADIAGEKEDAAGFRVRAACVHFRERLTGRAAEARPAFPLEGRTYTAVAASAEGLSAEGPGGQKRTFAWKDIPDAAMYELARGLGEAAEAKDRALDLLHLSRLAGEVVGPSEAAELEEKALALDRLLADEIGGRPQVSLNAAILDESSWVWDVENATGRDAETANNLSDDAPSIFHIYRYMRTLGPRRLAAIARRRPPYMTLLKRPRQTRGRVFKIRGGYIRRYKSMRWTKHPEHAEAGLRDLDFCFLRDTDVPGGVYLVSVPRDVRGFRRGDFVSVTGVYLRRWPYLRHGRWKWIPWIVGMNVRKIEISGAKGWGAFIFVLLGAGLAGGVALFLAARREWSDSIQSRDRLHARRRGGRDRIRRKVAEAMRLSAGAQAGGPGGTDGKTGESSPDPAGDDAKTGPAEGG